MDQNDLNTIVEVVGGQLSKLDDKHDANYQTVVGWLTDINNRVQGIESALTADQYRRFIRQEATRVGYDVHERPDHIQFVELENEAQT